MNIPPSVGMLLSLVAGTVIGGLSMYQYMDKQQIQADASQIKKDNMLAVEIKADTIEAKNTNAVAKLATKWRDRKPVIITQELTEDEIDTICANRYVPDDLMQSIRTEASRAWSRFNDMPYDNAATR